MLPASTRGGGIQFAFPDVCLTPGPSPSGIPIPYPNIGMCASAQQTTTRVKIANKAVCTERSEVLTTMGDEAGTLKGVMSGTTGDKTTYRNASTRVRVEGDAIETHLKMTAQNGSSANAPAGVQVSPSQTTVLVG